MESFGGVWTAVRCRETSNRGIGIGMGMGMGMVRCREASNRGMGINRAVRPRELRPRE